MASVYCSSWVQKEVIHQRRWPSKRAGGERANVCEPCSVIMRWPRHGRGRASVSRVVLAPSAFVTLMETGRIPTLFSNKSWENFESEQLESIYQPLLPNFDFFVFTKPFLPKLYECKSGTVHFCKCFHFFKLKGLGILIFRIDVNAEYFSGGP